MLASRGFVRLHSTALGWVPMRSGLAIVDNERVDVAETRALQGVLELTFQHGNIG